MLITVVLPYRNAAPTIRASLRSILEQTHRDLEVLAVDDGSTDDSRVIVEEMAASDRRIRVLGDARSLGVARRLNDCIDAAKGALCARIDSDDVAHPRRLELQAALLEAQPSVDLVGSSVVVLDGDEPLGVRIAPETHEAIMARHWIEVNLSSPTKCGRIEWFRRHRFAPGELCEDQELLMRAAPTSRFANVGAPLVGYREPSDAKVRGRRRHRRALVRRYRGRAASAALLLRDMAALARPGARLRGLEPLTDEALSHWRNLAKTGRWRDHDSAS